MLTLKQKYKELTTFPFDIFPEEEQEEVNKVWKFCMTCVLVLDVYILLAFIFGVVYTLLH